ncbi:magnesium and cobalt transport protein CorA [Cellulomonas endophytica]|uniref:magnesium and cobalt transport protein CorA n=1 Tax=Cellulomonas endophytica TaxID=2494735 RepID=UPI001F0C48E3|nr:magnesium and cobalt transport protein CorA [Cellulomonas endophytica]
MTTTDEATVHHCTRYRRGHRVAPTPPADAGDVAAVAARDGDGFVWLALAQPSEADVGRAAARFGLPPLAVEDAVHAHQRPKLEVYGDVVFAVLKPVVYVDRIEVVDVEELAVFLGPGFVVTVHHGRGAVVERVRAELDGVATDALTFGPAAVLYRLADLVVDGYEDAADGIDGDVDEIEDRVFGPGDDDHAERIYKLKREVVDFRRAVLPLARPLERLAAGGVPGVPEAATPYFRDVHDHVLRAGDAVESLDHQLTDVLQANSARVSAGQSRVALQQNSDMRKISAWAAIALVPTAIAGVYGMNFEHMPELTWTYGYPAVVAVIVTVCVALHRLFRRNGWL